MTEFNEQVQKTIDAMPKDAAQTVILSLMPNGNIDMQASVPAYSFVHQMLNRGVWELVIHEKESHLANAVDPEDKETPVEVETADNPQVEVAID